MANITPLFAELLKQQNVHLNPSPRQRSDAQDEFLKEAYRIVFPPSLLLSYSIHSFQLKIEN